MTVRRGGREELFGCADELMEQVMGIEEGREEGRKEGRRGERGFGRAD